MAANRARKILAAILIVAVAGSAVVFLTGSPDKEKFTREDDKFASVFVQMAVAREMAGNDRDSLKILYENIFRQYAVDSLWLVDYLSSLSDNTEKHKMIWDVIVEKLDSLNSNPERNSETDQKSSSTTNADSI